MNIFAKQQPVVRGQALSDVESRFGVFSQHNKKDESCQNFPAVLFLMGLPFNCIYDLLRANQGAGRSPLPKPSINLLCMFSDCGRKPDQNTRRTPCQHIRQKA